MSISGCSDCGSVQAAQQDALRTQVNMAVAKKGLDAAKAQGQAIVQLLQDIAGMNKTAGKGEQFDAVA
jgi:transcriptional accessory protein Tex/SPT6